MNVCKSIYLITLLTGTFGFMHGQEVPKAVLVDELSNPNCEDLWARLDAFANNIPANPTSTATVEISGKKNDTLGNFYWDSMIRGYFQSRKLLGQRWRVVRTAIGDQRKVRFWLTPPGALEPNVDPVNWEMSYTPGTKPFVFTNGESHSVEVGVCLYVDEIALLSMALSSNPATRVNVVLMVRNDREFVRRKRSIARMLVNDYSVSQSRFRFFKLINRKPNPYGIRPTTEYWLLP